MRKNETTARKRVIAGEAEQSEHGGHHSTVDKCKCSGPTTVDLDIDHYEGLDFHNAFDIRAPYS